MKKKNRTQVMYLTQHILEEYWQSNLEPLKEHLHKDILWIGSTDEEYLHGEEAMLKRLSENNTEMPPVSEILRQYFINHPQSIDKYTFLQNSAFTHWVKEKCSKMC
ncbi:MAG: hypothetical protein LKM41_06995 [Lachnospiraceae bacterium]|jgi:hypothetical protein|nr:hypothetical protein [Lachnospiraceae bacterium]